MLLFIEYEKLSPRFSLRNYSCLEKRKSPEMGDFLYLTFLCYYFKSAFTLSGKSVKQPSTLASYSSTSTCSGKSLKSPN